MYNKTYICLEELLEEIDDMIGTIHYTLPYQNDIDVMISGMERVRDCAMDSYSYDVAIQKHGRWVDKGWDGDLSWQIDGRGACWKVFECSACGSRDGNYKSNYCPHCGAKMDLGE